MAKDANGHGSEAHGGSNYARQAPTANGRARWYGSTMQQRIDAAQHMIDSREAAADKSAGDHIRDAASNALKNGPGHDSVRSSLQDAAAAELLRVGGNPKSAPVSTHPAHEPLNAWGQNAATAKAARKQLRQERIQRRANKRRG